MQKETKYRVIYGDTDCGNVVYYANYLKLFEIGRTELVRSLGISYKEIEEKYEIMLPVVEAWIKYKSSAKYDDLLVIYTDLKEIKPRKVVFTYQIKKDGKLLAEGYTVHIPVNKSGRSVKFPEEIYKLLEKAKTGEEK
jgi:acyl-CoA thioester hydrolase